MKIGRDLALRVGILIVAVIVLSLLGVQVPDRGSPARILVWLGVGLVVLFARVAGPSNMDVKHEGERPAEKDPRYDGGPTAPQLAGAACAACKQKIMGSFDGGFCKTCRAPIHNDCRKEHRATAHTRHTGAYR